MIRLHLVTLAILSLLMGLNMASAQSSQPANKSNFNKQIDALHDGLWARFIEHDTGIMFDFVNPDGSVILPTPEECQAGKPNHLGWWTPIENGAFFNGLYLVGLLDRYQIQPTEQLRQRIERLVDGLLLLNQIGSVPGFIGRGVAKDGKSHYLMGSDDQTSPWFHGLYHYLKSDLPDPNRRKLILARLIDVANALDQNKWFLPNDTSYKSHRGYLAAGHARTVARYLFILRAMHDLTGEKRWLDEYHKKLTQKVGKEQLTRQQICAQGMSQIHKGRPIENFPWWTCFSNQLSLRDLCKMEDNPQIVSDFLAGMKINAKMATHCLNRLKQWEQPGVGKDDLDWRKLNAYWKPQHSPKDAVKVAVEQLKHWNQQSPNRQTEFQNLRNPLFAVWTIVLVDDSKRNAEVDKLLREVCNHIDPDTMASSSFFPAECATYALLKWKK